MKYCSSVVYLFFFQNHTWKSAVIYSIGVKLGLQTNCIMSDICYIVFTFWNIQKICGIDMDSGHICIACQFYSALFCIKLCSNLRYISVQSKAMVISPDAFKLHISGINMESYLLGNSEIKVTVVSNRLNAKRNSRCIRFEKALRVYTKNMPECFCLSLLCS